MSSALNSNVAVVSVVDAAGPVAIVTTGGVMSPLSHEYAAGVWSTSAPEALTARTCELVLALGHVR